MVETHRARPEVSGAVAVPAPRSPTGPAPVGAVDPVHQTEVLTELHEWAGQAMAVGAGAGAVGEVPVFGSPAWCALPDGAPAKIAAVARAAMAWWQQQQTRAQQAAEDHVQASHAISAAHDWTRHAREHSRHPA